jgi:hypothetical protein
MVLLLRRCGTGLRLTPLHTHTVTLTLLRLRPPLPCPTSIHRYAATFVDQDFTTVGTLKVLADDKDTFADMLAVCNTAVDKGPLSKLRHVGRLREALKRIGEGDEPIRSPTAPGGPGRQPHGPGPSGTVPPLRRGLDAAASAVPFPGHVSAVTAIPSATLAFPVPGRTDQRHRPRVRGAAAATSDGGGAAAAAAVGTSDAASAGATRRPVTPPPSYEQSAGGVGDTVTDDDLRRSTRGATAPTAHNSRQPKRPRVQRQPRASTDSARPTSRGRASSGDGDGPAREVVQRSVQSPAAPAVAAAAAAAAAFDLNAVIAAAYALKDGQDVEIKLAPGTHYYCNGKGIGTAKAAAIREKTLTLSAPNGATVMLTGKNGFVWNGANLRIHGGSAPGHELILRHEDPTLDKEGSTIVVRQSAQFKHVSFVGTPTDAERYGGSLGVLTHACASTQCSPAACPFYRRAHTAPIAKSACPCVLLWHSLHRLWFNLPFAAFF